METGRKPNRLIHEKSPYLLQHAHNPVDWYPWGEEAFARARAEQKPIFLSVGYATCHWCHVMERESFEVDSIANIMNEYFVCVKVDREERPDVDRVYMTALQGMGQDGGWPMSMFLTPDLKPFYGGTYFPPVSRYGRAGFPEILRRIHEVWQNERLKVTESADGIARFLRETSQAVDTTAAAGREALKTCFEQLRSTYDAAEGGFGGGPKFPRPCVFTFLLRYYARTGEQSALEMTRHTLDAIARGGTADHIGGGFHRYAVDAAWRVPHFEKMLYDQAQLVCSYVDLYRITGDSAYASVVRQTLEYVLRDMTDHDGGFTSAEDADSPRPDDPRESGEGAFYTWSKKEIMELLGNEPGEIFCRAYGVRDSGNAPFDPQQEFTGRNILYAALTPDETAKSLGLATEAVRSSLSTSRKVLLAQREKRPRPLRDDKILTSWNGLMISAFSRASEALEDPQYLRAAQRSASFVIDRLYDPSTGRLRRRYRDGDAGFDGNLVDYAFFVQGLLDLFEASADVRWLSLAVDLTEKQIALFSDLQGGGFFDTSGEDPTILVRMKDQYDSAEPTGNAVSAMNLLRLSQILDREEWRTLAVGVFRAFSRTLQKQPVAMPQMAAALDYSIGTPRQIVIAGRRDDPAAAALLHEAFRRYIPDMLVLCTGSDADRASLARFAAFVEPMAPVNGRPAAYICENYVCKLPLTDPGEVGKVLVRK